MRKIDLRVKLSRLFLVIGIIGMGVFSLGYANGAKATDEDDRWSDIKEEYFAGRAVSDGAEIIGLETPYRAYDAAFVPLEMKMLTPQTKDRHISKMYLFIDMNPIPLAGIFQFHEFQGKPVNLSTRIRVNEYTHVRVIAETNDNELYMVSRYVKAAGGCSAPAMNDAEVALKRMGKMKFKTPDGVVFGQYTKAQAMISHPNYSGFQFDQVTRNYIMPHYINRMEISYNDKMIISADTDISMSENPIIHFSFMPEKPGVMKVKATDSQDNIYEKEWPIKEAKAASL